MIVTGVILAAISASLAGVGASTRVAGVPPAGPEAVSASESGHSAGETPATRAAKMAATRAGETPAAPGEPALPVTFARSGRPATVDIVPPGQGAVVLRAYGRTWTSPVELQNAQAVVVVPAVRVPTVFSVVRADGPKTQWGQLVAYPDAPLDWDANIVLISAAAPAWFDQWAKAVGLPVDTPERAATRPAAPGESRLEIVGTAAGGANCLAMVERSRRNRTNVLVLDASWYGPRSDGRIEIAPPAMRGALAGLAGQAWLAPLAFVRPAAAAPAILNRWAWIGDDDLVFVERVWQATADTAAAPADGRVVVSYVPWEQQLGRRDVADALLLALLRAAAAPAGPAGGVTWRAATLLYPKQDETTQRERPILTAAVASGCPSLPDGPAGAAWIVDLRGPDHPPAEMRNELDALKGRVEPNQPLLILGDDPILDECPWLKLDRDKQRSKAPGVRWWAADGLDLSAGQRVRLMRELTELGVLLVDSNTLEEKQHEAKRDVEQ